MLPLLLLLLMCRLRRCLMLSAPHCFGRRQQWVTMRPAATSLLLLLLLWQCSWHERRLEVLEDAWNVGHAGHGCRAGPDLAVGA